MPSIETPPNPAASAPPPPHPPKPVTVVTRNFGELDHTELVHLLDSLEGDQAKSRFRESIYISVIVYLILAWLLIYGPKYVFHTGSIVQSASAKREKDRLTQLELQSEIAKELAKPKFNKPVPKLDTKAMDQLKAMARAAAAAKAAAKPAPQAPAPTPAPAPPAPVQAQAPAPPPLPAAPTPQLPVKPAPAVSSIPDAPHPAAPSSQSSLSQSFDQASKNVANARPGSRSGGAPSGSTRVGQQGAGTGPVEILSDTRGVDFTEYIKRILRMIKAGWLPLIPEECYPPLSKEGSTLIHFTIAKNGELTKPMALDGPSGDRAIDKAAWGSITGVGQFPPLPSAYTGDTLELRIQFIISRNASDTQ